VQVSLGDQVLTHLSQVDSGSSSGGSSGKKPKTSPDTVACFSLLSKVETQNKRKKWESGSGGFVLTTPNQIFLHLVNTNS
jgi:hypothetical protein